ncbi:site-specific integrase [Natrialba swarupiae]|uniref:Site-specific integrase n=2 Tax=Natrialba swarupiae TaxID=2448032 RepID=A0A5D5AET9_9EURY|nr:site-specific integrase [Natrialba swarupiae]
MAIPGCTMTSRNPEPSECQSMYLNSREGEVRDSTLKTHEYRLNHFVRWCDQNNVENLTNIDPIDIEQYKNWRRKDGDLSKSALKGQLDTLRVFMRYLGRLGIVDSELCESVPSVKMKRSDEVNNRKISEDNAQAILETLDRYHYATVEHVWFLLAWRTSARVGALRALDVDDYDPDNQFLYFRERDGTQLKNGPSGERPVALSDETCAILDDYLQHHRVTNTDQHGREPLFSSKQGRVHRNTMRRWCYTLTCPSFRGDECETEECNSQSDGKTSHKCDDSVSPHAIRRASITHFLRKDMPEKMVSDRADVSEDVLEKHYDKRSAEEKMEQRRAYLDNI